MHLLRHLTVLLSALVSALTTLPGFADHQPNILLLMAEDLSPRIGAYGDRVARTPNLDALARSSIRYDHAFTTAGVCAPSRAAMITGLHQISFAAQHMRTSTAPLGPYLAKPPAHMKAFPEMLRANGYYTFTDRKLDYQFSGIQAGSGPFTIWDEDGAVDTAWRNAAPGQPFFGLINFLETHESGVMRAEGEAHSTSHAQTQAMRKALGMVAPVVTDPALVTLPPYYPDTPAVRRDLARHYDNIAAMDKRIGRILTELIRDGLFENTVIIWTSDHGDGLPRAKRELYDSGIRVPMLISLPQALRDPILPTPRTDDRLVSFVDLAPTILELAQVTPPSSLHGKSVFGEVRKYIYASRDRIDEVMDRQRAIRNHRYKYIRSWHPDVPGGHPLNYRDNLDMVRAMRAQFEQGELAPNAARWFQPAGKEQLYDLAQDPHELNNLATSQDHQGIRTTLARQLDVFLARVGDTSQTPEPELRASLLSGDDIPSTPSPSIAIEQDKLVITTPPGSSVGYRVGDQTRWQLYHTPIPLSVVTYNAESSVVQAKAVRYGWQESAVVSIDLSHIE